MKKVLQKYLAVLAVTCLLLGMAGMGAFAETATSGKLISALSQVDRDLIIPALPFLSTDSGLDMLDEALEKQRNGQDAGILGSVIIKALQYTDDMTLQNGVDTLRVLDESFRQRCQSIYQNLVGISLNDNEAKGVSALIGLMNKKDSRAGAVLAKHQISDSMFAAFLEAASQLNTAPLFSMNASGEFYIGSYPTSYMNPIDAIWQADGVEMDTRQTLVTGVYAMNTGLSAAEKTNVAYLLKRTGLLDKIVLPEVPEKDVPKLPGGGAGAFAEKEPAEDNSDVLMTLDVTEEGIISVPGTFNNPVVYRVSGAALEPVKMSLYVDGMVKAELSKGQYVIKEAVPYFTDCNGWSKPYIEALYARNIVGGKAEKVFAPEDRITREEFVKLVTELFGLVDETAKTSFVDVPENAWYYRYVASAQQYGLINGVSETEFGVGQLIYRQDMAKIISDLLRKKGLTMKEADSSVFADFSAVSDYAKNHVLSVCGLGIISGDDRGNFNPRYFATRGESAKMIYGMIKAVLTR